MFITQLYLIAYVITPCTLTSITGDSKFVTVKTIESPLYNFLLRVLISKVLWKGFHIPVAITN